MKKRLMILVSSLTVVLLVLRLYWPYLTVYSLGWSSSKGEEGSKEACNRIVSLGKKAIPAVISGIEDNSPWVKGYCYLPSVLKRIDGAAKEHLVAAIEKQNDPLIRAYLVYSLQEAFDDYSKLSIVLNDIQKQKLKSRRLLHFGSQLELRYPAAPPLFQERNMLNEAFIVFWENQKEYVNMYDAK